MDYDVIRNQVKKHNTEFRIIEMGFDRWNATQLTTQLAGDGLTMVETGQGFQSMSDPTKELIKMVKGAEFAHGHNSVLTWMADNLVTVADAAGNLKPDKSRAREKIDGMVAFIMAIGRSLSYAEVPGGAAAVWSL